MQPSPSAAVAASTLTLLAGSALAQTAGLHELLPPAGVTPESIFASDISADGQWAVGGYYLTSAYVPVRWPLTGPDAFIAQPLAFPTINPPWVDPIPSLVNGDGTVIMGQGRLGTNPTPQTFRWTASGVTRPFTFADEPRDISADGTRVLFAGAVYNTLTGAAVSTFFSALSATSMNADGTVMMGWAATAPFGAARYSPAGGMEGVCGLIGCGVGNSYSNPVPGAISDDSSTLAGVINQPGTGYGGYDASLFFYRAGQLVTVPFICGTQHTFVLNSVSADGHASVGTMNCVGPSPAYYYDSVRGLRSLRDALLDQGVNVDGWSQFSNASEVSANGAVVLGRGQKPGNFVQYPFVAIIPPACDTIDFNQDGLFPDTLDIADFLSVFADGVC
jgi:hypothetical protein